MYVRTHKIHTNQICKVFMEINFNRTFTDTITGIKKNLMPTKRIFTITATKKEHPNHYGSIKTIKSETQIYEIINP